MIQTATFTTLLEYELVLVEKENDYLVRPLAVTKVIYCSHPGMLIVELFMFGGKKKENMICSFFNSFPILGCHCKNLAHFACFCAAMASSKTSGASTKDSLENDKSGCALVSLVQRLGFLFFSDSMPHM